MKRLLLLLVVFLSLNVAAFSQRKRTEMIVTLKDGQSIERFNRNNSTRTLKHVADTNVYLIAQEGDDDQAVRKARRDSTAESVELNSAIALTDNADTLLLLDDNADTLLLLDQKTILNGVQVPALYANQPALTIIEANRVRNISTGAATRVAIIDTGVDFNHPALKPWLDAGKDVVNGRSASIYDGLDLSDNAAELLLLDNNGRMATSLAHGTLVAGTVHAVAPDAMIVPIKAFDAFGMTSMFNVVQAVYAAIELKADVINMSFSTSQYSSALRDAVSKAHTAGITLVSSMGNGGQYNDNIYPAAYTDVYGVEATDFQDHIAAFSNYGKTASIAAPGLYVISTAPGGKYAAVAGTSFSAPLVSGTVALLASLQNRGQSQGTLVITSAESIDSKNPGFEKLLGKGRLNARRALEKRQ
jgi:subtilisin family serine protease